MKTGLNRVAAFILASATLFGGTVVASSTAYADDVDEDVGTLYNAR